LTATQGEEAANPLFVAVDSLVSSFFRDPRQLADMIADDLFDGATP
jgi:hypothetical protein